MNRYLLAEAAQKQIEARMDDTPFETEDENESFVFGLCTAFNELNSVPAADVRGNRRGEWISGAQDFETGKTHECSICGGFIDYNKGGADDYNFCPYCGAKMERI